MIETSTNTQPKRNEAALISTECAKMDYLAAADEKAAENAKEDRISAVLSQASRHYQAAFLPA